MRVLVTGGAGYIGSITARALATRGHQVRILDDLSTGHRAAAAAVPGAELVVADLCRDPLAPALAGIEAVVHLAGRALVPESVREPGLYYRVNTLGTLRLLEAMRRAGTRRIVFSSTCAVYGLPGEVPIPEEAPPRPLTAYGASKLAVEHMLRDFATAHGLQALALRYFNAAGASDDGLLGEDHEPETHLVPRVLAAAARGEPVPIYGTDYPTPDGTCVRDFIHVEDLALAHLLALQAPGPAEGFFAAYNLGSGRGHSVREVIATAREVTGRPIAVVEQPRRAGDPPALLASCARAREALGFTARRSLAEMIASAWRWHTSHPAGYGEGSRAACGSGRARKR
ncbi:MAG: UDP-glucose 4-epimerase GalE [Planctomycetota bacterium]|nr:MAG: UDP-glucose 4-epimerase GalE [Planctomycetota bacterium]